MHPRFAAPARWALLLTLLASPSHAAWPVDGLGVCTASCPQSLMSAVSDGEGGFYVAWNDQRDCSSYTIGYLQHVRANGTPAAGWPDQGMPVSTTFSGQMGVVLSPDGSGGVFAAWNDSRRGPEAVIAEHIARDGSRLWDPAGVSVCDSIGAQALPGILADGSGGLYVGWLDHRRGRDDGLPHRHPIYDVFAQHLDATGLPTWGPAGIAAVTTSYIVGPPFLSPARGGVQVTWQDDLGPVRLQRFETTGAPLLGPDGAAIGGPFSGPLTDDGRGGLVAAFGVGPDGTTDLYAQRIDSTGAAQWGANADLVSNAFADQRPSGVAADGSGGMFVAWYDLRNGHDWDIYAQHLDASGAATWTPGGVAVCTAPNFQINAHVIADGHGGCVLAWYDVRDSSTSFDIYAQRLASNGSVAAGWPVNGVALCRAFGDQSNPMLTGDGKGGAFVVWNDFRGDGDVYAQHVSASGTVGDTSGNGGVVPGPSVSFGLARASSNPGGGEALVFTLSLPDGLPAELTLLDALGRSLATSRTTLPGGGHATVTLGPGRRLAPGVYLVRAQQGSRTALLKVAVVH